MRKLGLVVICSIFVCFSCSQAEEPLPLKVCALENQFFFSQTENGYQGLEYDILRSFAEDRGRVLEIEWIRRSDPESGRPVDQSSCNVLAMTITRTSEREKTRLFSEPYFPVRVVLVERIGEVSTDFSSLTGKTIVTGGGEQSMFATVLKEKNPEIKVVNVSGIQNLFEMVSNGEADALANDSWVIATHIKDFPDLTVTLALTDLQFFCFPLGDNKQLKSELDEHIRQIKADGTFSEFLVSNFGLETAQFVAEPLGLELQE